MKVFPIHVPRHRYSGNNPPKRQKKMDYNRDAARLEKYINDRIQANDSPIQQYILRVHCSQGRAGRRVREILFGGDCGPNGFTAAKSEEALTHFMTELGAKQSVGNQSPLADD
jgi:hypothetical protein